MNTTKQKAYEKVKKNKTSKAELEVLIKWAESEIFEWRKFVVECKSKLTNYEK